MKRISFLIFIIILGGLEIKAQSYPFDSIPARLKIRADAVVRSEQYLYTILGPGKAVEKMKMVITLLNDNAEIYRYITVPYDNFSKIRYLRGAVYDEKGKIIRMLGISDVYDMSTIPGASFYSDDRIKFLYSQKYKYPYTIEYEFEKEYSSIMNYPSWRFQTGTGLSVEKSGIQIIIPKGMKFRYYGKNLSNSIDSVINDNSRIYTWQEENLEAVVPESYYRMIPESTYPAIYTAPLEFEFGGYKGSMESWKTLGEWNYNLIRDLDKLPPSELSKVSGIVSQTKDLREQTRLIYEYVQSRTRYVSIQVGIGGYKPADPSLVAVNGFGDCKALVNFTKALLNAAGINSFYTLVRSGKYNNINRNFVNDQFDHIILCVPMEKDTVWLECTNPTLPFNYLGSFTGDRYALLLMPEGGKLVRTPHFEKDDNVIKRTGTVTLYDKGPSLFKVSDSYSGYHYGDYRTNFIMKTDDEIKRYLYSSLRFYDFTVNSVSSDEQKTEKPSVRLNYGISVNDFTVNTGNKIIFNPSIKGSNYLKDSPVTMLIPLSETETDSITYYLPYGYKVDFRPENITMNTGFGRFTYQIRVEPDRIVYTRYLELNKQKVPAEKFGELRKFINSIAKADKGLIILGKS